MIFWIGFFIMFINEGFVMMRHVSPWFSKQRDNLIEKYGDGWQTFHGTVDYLWVIIIALGFTFSPHRAQSPICLHFLLDISIYVDLSAKKWLNDK